MAFINTRFHVLKQLDSAHPCSTGLELRYQSINLNRPQEVFAKKPIYTDHKANSFYIDKHGVSDRHN